MQSLLAAIDRNSHGQANQFISLAIDQNVKSAKELYKVLEIGILAGGKEGSSRAIKGAWLMHRKKVCRLKDTLKEAEGLLHLALQT